MYLEFFLSIRKRVINLFSVVSICLIGMGYTNAVRSMSTADWCVLPYSYCINAVSNMYSIYQFYIKWNWHALLQHSILSWMFLFWADYTLEKWQLDILLWVMTCQFKKKSSIKIMTEVRFCWTFLCSHVMKTLKLYEDMDLLCFSKHVSICLLVYIPFPNVIIWNERNINVFLPKKK